MKKLAGHFYAPVALSVILTLAGCGSSSVADRKSDSVESGTVQLTPTQAAITGNGEGEEDRRSISPDTGSDAASSLVVYFSWSGNTRQMAEWIADESGSDIYPVTPKEAYSEDFDSCADRAKAELDNGIRPELADLMDEKTMAQYDTIYVGFPVWWYDLPMPVTAFLERYDFAGKTIVPFFSHNGSSGGASAPETLTKVCPGAKVRTEDALSISGNDVENSEVQIRKWVNGFTK